MARRSSPRRIAARSLLPILGGVLMTWLVAWLAYLAHRTQPPWRQFTGMFEGWLGNDHGRMPQCRLPSPNGEVSIWWFGGVGYECVQVTPSWGSGVPHPLPADWFEYYHFPTEVPAQEAALYPGSTCRLPSWAIIPGPNTSARVAETHAAGWPMLALKYLSEQDVVMGPTGSPLRVTYTSEWGLSVSRWFRTWNNECLPLRPMPLGFAVDTLLFAALMWASVRGDRAWRLSRRRRRGRCANCNYDRTGLAPGAVCPECGAAAAAFLS